MFITLAEFNLANESLSASKKVIPPDQLGVKSIKSIDAQVYRNYYLGLSNAMRSKFGDADFSAAVSAYQLSIEAYPTFSHAYYQLGIVYYDVQNYQLARRQFENAIQLYQESENDHPNRANAYYQLGYIYYQTADYDNGWRQLHLAKVNGKQNVDMSEHEKRQKRLDLERNLRRVSISPIRY